jgi:hypothetical protein
MRTWCPPSPAEYGERGENVRPPSLLPAALARVTAKRPDVYINWQRNLSHLCGSLRVMARQESSGAACDKSAMAPPSELVSFGRAGTELVGPGRTELFSPRRLAPLVVLLLLLSAVRCAASPPDFTQIPAEARWLVHIDVDAVRPSAAARVILKAAAEQWKILPSQLEKLNRQSGMDLRKDLHSLTVYGGRLPERKAVLVMRADWPQQTFRQKLSLAENHSVTQDRPYEIHCWRRNNSGEMLPVAGAMWKAGTFVFAPTAADVKSSLEVLDGKRHSLSGSNSKLAAEVPAGTIMTVRLIGVGDSLPVESPLLKQSDQIDMVCGENEGEWFVRARLAAKSPAAARDAKHVADGLLALARLKQSGDTASLALLDRVQLKVDGQNLVLDFRAAAGDVVQCTEKALARYKAAAVKTPDQASTAAPARPDGDAK